MRFGPFRVGRTGSFLVSQAATYCLWLSSWSSDCNGLLRRKPVVPRSTGGHGSQTAVTRCHKPITTRFASPLGVGDIRPRARRPARQASESNHSRQHSAQTTTPSKHRWNGDGTAMERGAGIRPVETATPQSFKASGGSSFPIRPCHSTPPPLVLPITQARFSDAEDGSYK